MKHYEDIYYEAPQKFEQKKIQGFFLSNAGEYISLILTIVFFHLFILLIVRITKYFQKFSSLIQRGIGYILNYHFYINLVWGLYLELSLSFFLQLTSLKTMEYSEEIINYIFFCLTIVPIIFPFTIAAFIRKGIYPHLTKVFQERLEFKYYQMVIYSRKLVMSFIVVVFQFQPLTQISLLVLWHLIMSLIIYFKQPYGQKVENIRDLVSEILFFSGTILLYFFDLFNAEEEKKILIGWIIICFFGAIIFIELSFFLKETSQIIYRKIHQVIRFFKERRNNKVYPVNDADLKQIDDGNEMEIQCENKIASKNIHRGCLDNTYNDDKTQSIQIKNHFITTMNTPLSISQSPKLQSSELILNSKQRNSNDCEGGIQLQFSSIHSNKQLILSKLFSSNLIESNIQLLNQQSLQQDKNGYQKLMGKSQYYINDFLSQKKKKEEVNNLKKFSKFSKNTSLEFDSENRKYKKEIKSDFQLDNKEFQIDDDDDVDINVKVIKR